MKALFCVLCFSVAVQAAPPKKPMEPLAPSSLKTDAEGQPLAAGMVNLNGSTIAKAQFLKKCATPKKGADLAADFAGRAVKIVGPISVVAPGRLGFSIGTRFDSKRKEWEAVTVSLTELGGNFKAGTYSYAAGNIVAAYGIVTDKGELSLWESELLPPGVTWTVTPKPQPVSAGPTQKLEFEMIVKNSGPQMASAEFTMKLQHPDAKEMSSVYKFQPLNPGMNRVSLGFEWPKGTIPTVSTKVSSYAY